MAKASTKKASTAAPADETKAQKFSRLASARVSKAVKAIEQIGNLSGSGYERTDAQVQAIKGHLVGAVNGTMNKFDKSAPAAAKVNIQI